MTTTTIIIILLSVLALVLTIANVYLSAANELLDKEFKAEERRLMNESKYYHQLYAELKREQDREDIKELNS